MYDRVGPQLLSRTQFFQITCRLKQNKQKPVSLEEAGTGILLPILKYFSFHFSEAT